MLKHSKWRLQAETDLNNACLSDMSDLEGKTM